MALNKNKVIAAAQRYAQRGLFDRAISELRTIVEEDPDDVRVWHRIADLQIRKGSVAQAVATYTRIANYYSERGFFLKGVAVYKQILNADPALVDAHRKLGELYVKLGLGPEAISQFQIVVGTCEREGRHQESLELLKKIVELGPEDESNRIRLAEAYARQSENEAAIDQFKLTLTLLRENRRFDEYVQVAERLLYLYPDELDVVRSLSEVYLERNDAKRALARLQTLFRADPSDPSTLVLLARAFTAIGQVAKAISVYRELARIHGEAGNGAAQAEAWAQLLALDPDDPEALEATGNVGTPTGEVPLASGGYSTAGLAPSAGERASGLLDDVELLLKYSLKDHARERLDKVFEVDPYHEGALLKLKALALADDRTDEAADALMRLAEGAEKAGDPQKAMSWLGEVIQLRPGDPIAADFMRRISSGMARELASSAEPADAAADYDAPADYDVDLGEIDFDASINDEPMGDGFDLDLGELDASVDEEFAEFMSDGPSAPIAPVAGAVITPPPPADDAFGDLLADEPPPADDAFGDLLADEPPPADDAFGDLLVDEPLAPAAEDDFGDLLADEPLAPAAEDDFGDLLADEPLAPAAEDDFGDLLADDAPTPAAEDGFGDLLADEPLAPAAEDDFGDLLADEAPAPAAEPGEPLADEGPAPAVEEDFGDLLADEPPADDAFGDLLADEPPPADDAFGDLLADDAPDVLVPDPPAADPLDDLNLDDADTADAFEADAALDEAAAVDPVSDFDAPAEDDGFADALPARDELPDDDEFADLLLDNTGTEAEPDFGVYDSSDGETSDPLERRLPHVSGAPSEIDIDIDVSMDMPDLDFDAPVESEPTPEPDLGAMPPPPPPPPRRPAGPPPPPPPPAAAFDDDLDDIEELDLDEIIELDDDDLVLEDDSVDDSLDDSVDDSSADSSISLDGSSDDISGPSPFDDATDASEADDGLIAAAPSNAGELDLGGMPADDDPGLGEASVDDSLDLGDASNDDLHLGDASVDDGVEPDDASDDDRLDLGDVSGDDGLDLGDVSGDDGLDLGDLSGDDGLDGADASSDDALGLSEPDDGADALDLGDLSSDDGLDLADASADEPSDPDETPRSDEATEASSVDDSADEELLVAADSSALDDADADASADAAAATDIAGAGEVEPGTVDDAIAPSDAMPSGPPAEAVLEIDEAEPWDAADDGAPADRADRESTDALPALDDDGVAPDAEDESAAAEPATPGSAEVPAAETPAAAPTPRPRPLPRPPGLGASSLKLDTGQPSAPKPLSASSLSLDTRSMPSAPKPPTSMKPPAAPSAPDTEPAVDEQALLPPPPVEEEPGDGDDTIAVSASVMADMFEDGALDPSVGDQTEAGGMSHDSPAPLSAVPTEADLDEELAEIDFLIESDLIDDARELVRELRVQHPEHQGLQARAARLESPFDADEDDFLSGFTDDFELDFGEVKGAELSDLGDDEADTHFDLGLAFKEMGQYGKAIAELELAARRDDKRAEAFRIIALCHAEQGNAEQAASTLQDALAAADLPLSARAGLQYDLASVYEQLGQPDEARAQLESIVAAGMDDFLDVKARLAALQS